MYTPAANLHCTWPDAAATKRVRSRIEGEGRQNGRRKQPRFIDENMNASRYLRAKCATAYRVIEIVVARRPTFNDAIKPKCGNRLIFVRQS